MNFNIAGKSDYTLNTSLIDEMIRLYGTKCRFVMVDKIVDGGTHQDLIPEAAVFSDFKTLGGSTISKEIWVLLTEPEGYPNGLSFAFNNFGLINDDGMQVLVSTNSMQFLSETSKGSDVFTPEGLKVGSGAVHPKEIISNLLVFPNGKVMEITDCQLHVPGVNNAFAYSDMPSAYQLSLKSFNFDASAVSAAMKTKEIRDLTKVGVTGTVGSSNTSDYLVDHKAVRTIDEFFERREANTELVKEEAEKEVLTVKCLKEIAAKPKIDDVFGSY